MMMLKKKIAMKKDTLAIPLKEYLFQTKKLILIR
jgi:hypothetical protein